MLEKKARIISLDKRYRKEAYPAVPMFHDKIGTFITGQHIDPVYPETKNNLTIAEMMGEVALSPDKLKRFPYIIVPEVRVPIENGRTFDLSQHEDGSYRNPKDKAEFDFIKLQPFVSANKTLYKDGTHYFYVEDLQAEAQERVSIREKRYQAEKLVRETAGISKYRDIALLLNYKISEFRMNMDHMSEVQIQDRLLDACEKWPNEVVSCFNASAEEQLFILKAVYKGIIRREGISFFDGQQFLGDTVEEVIKFMRDEKGSKYKLRWTQLLYKSNEPAAGKSASELDEERYNTLKGEIALAILDNNLEKAKKLYEQAVIIHPDSKELEQFKSRLEPKQEPKSKSLEEQDDRVLKMTLGRLGVSKDKWKDLDKKGMIDLIKATEATK